jgi:hypothetical protein
VGIEGDRIMGEVGCRLLEKKLILMFFYVIINFQCVYPLEENLNSTIRGRTRKNIILEQVSYNIEVFSQGAENLADNDRGMFESVSIPYSGFANDSLLIKNLEKGFREHRYLKLLKKRPFYDSYQTHIEVSGIPIPDQQNIKGAIHSLLAILTAGIVNFILEVCLNFSFGPFYFNPMLKIKYEIYQNGNLAKTYTYKQGYEFYFGSVSQFFFWLSDWDKMDKGVIYPTVDFFFEDATNDGYFQ